MNLKSILTLKIVRKKWIERRLRGTTTLNNKQEQNKREGPTLWAAAASRTLGLLSTSNQRHLPNTAFPVEMYAFTACKIHELLPSC